MKSTPLLILVLGCSSAFGQAISHYQNSNEFREYAVNAVPVQLEKLSDTVSSEAPAVTQDFESIWKQPENPNSAVLSVPAIEAILKERIAMSLELRGENLEAQKKQ